MLRRNHPAFGAPVGPLLVLGAFLMVAGSAAAPPEDALTRAERLFGQQRWAEARAAYDTAAAAVTDWASPTARQLVRRTVTCSLRLDDWEGAWQCVERFRQRKKDGPANRDRWRSRSTEAEEAAQALGAIRHLELVRELLLQLAEHAQAGPPRDNADRLRLVTAARIKADFALAEHLLGPGFDTHHTWATDNDWWWATSDPLGQDRQEREESWYWRETGVPVGPDGRPRFVRPPPRYAADLGPGAKVLFLLEEIARLDTTEAHDHAARALLQRALIARRLYGPGSDPAWHSAQFYYFLDLRPSFRANFRLGPGKPFWDLADDEARTLVDGRVQVIRLPETENPLALLRLLERQYPESDAVPEAIYLRALYYQSRQQFHKAAEEYQRLLKAYPGHRRAAAAKKRLGHIRHPDVLLGSTAAYPAGSKPTLWFALRQTTRVEFTARSVDLGRYLQDAARKTSQPWELRFFGNDFFLHRWHDNQTEARLATYLGEKRVCWSETVPEAEHVTTAKTVVPLSDAGAYLVEARVPDRSRRSRALVVLTDVAIVPRQLDSKSLVFVADARTGQPVANQEVQFFAEDRGRWRKTARKTNQDGVIEETFQSDYDVVALAVSPAGGAAVAEFRAWHRNRGDKEPVHHAITDRPVYRPGTAVQFRVWARQLADHAYLKAAAGQLVRVSVTDPQNHPVRSFELRTDRFGGVSGAFPVGPEAPLGAYSIEVHNPGRDYGEQAGSFRVEAYRKPEFEVRVEPAADLVRPGEKARVRIAARYYFGGPVAGAKVRYQVLRQEAGGAPPPPRPFDWLYGPGYGQYAYRYPWLQNGKDWAEEPEGDADRRLPWGDDSRGTPVTHGEVSLDSRGTAEVEVDAAASPSAPGARDHQLVFEVEVRDDSRRTVQGRGQVAVRSRELAAAVELDRGWYTPNTEAVVDVTVRNAATGKGVAADGTLRLTRISYAGPDNGETRLETVRTWAVRTDSRGRLTARVPVPAEGQYRVEFVARDARDQEVGASTVFWVHGPGFRGEAFRYADLEIIPDRRSYAVGDVAHLLFHVARPKARVLWSSDAQEDWLAGYRFLDVPNHVAVIDLPIEDRHVPNCFVEATVVGNGRAATETCELFVPPVNDLLKVRIHPNKAVYEPGEQGSVRIAVTDAAGKPVSGQVTFAAYDKAVTYIEEETTAGPSALIARRLRRRYAEPQSSLDGRGIASSGTFVCPEFEIYDDGHPMIMLGGSAPTGGDPADTGARAPRAGRAGSRGEREAGGAGRPDAEPAVRSNFEDTALWAAALELGPDGTVETRLPLPESLTTWRLRAHALTESTQVGEATSEVVTTKDFLVRQQAPRFLVEGDEVVLSANIHNGLKTDRRVTAELLMPAALLESRDDARPEADGAGNLRLRRQVTVPAGATRRCDWPVRVRLPGTATVTVKARAEGAGDAMRLSLPILPYGVPRDTAAAGSFRPEEEGERTVAFTVPEGADPLRTRLEVTVAPGPVGPMLDALPFLMGYPYGCTEQTMSRFYPSVLTAEVLKKLGTDLEALGKRRSQDAPDRKDRFNSSPGPVFDSAELRRMTEAGLERLYNFQHEDGGWGWWQHDASSASMTAYVLMGLQTARRAGVAVRPTALENGYAYLLRQIEPGRKPDAGEPAAQPETDAYVAYVLSLGIPGKLDRFDLFNAAATPGAQRRRHLNGLFEHRRRLNAYGLALLALALQQSRETERARLVLRELLARVEVDEKAGTARVRTPLLAWWFWWDNDIETNAWALRAVVAIDPHSDVAPRLARWLLGQRHHGHYWRSTRDTALAVAALGDYVTIPQAAAAECAVILRVDGKVVRRAVVTPESFLKTDPRLVLDGSDLPPGRHRITVTKTGRGELAYAWQLRTFVKGGPIRAEGKGMAVRREYYRVTAEGVTAREPLAPRERLAAGDVLEVVLRVAADSAYDYLAFEDPKPAGCEHVQLQSGTLWFGSTWANVELRDDRVLLFVPYLERGEHVFRYRLRAEVPGTFRALPATGFAMYAPEIRAGSDEGMVRVGE
jgi:uncharacterized protein YfaS (alpha-2-macroglobulin family)